MKPTILREAAEALVSHYPPRAKVEPDSNNFESYEAPEAVIQAFLSALDIGPCREDIEETIRQDAHDWSLPPGLKLALVHHAFSIGTLPSDVLRECAIALRMYCDPGDPRREYGKELLASLEDGAPSA